MLRTIIQKNGQTIPSSGKEQDGPSNQHTEKVEENVTLGLNTLLNACRLITLGIISQPNPSEQLTGIFYDTCIQ